MDCTGFLVKARRRRKRSETSGGDRVTSVVAPSDDRYSRSPQSQRGGKHMKFAIGSFGLLFVLLATAVVSAQTTTIDFNNEKLGEAPSGFSTALTGKGKPGKWVVMKDPASPNQGSVLAQTDADTTGYRFPVCVYDGLSAKDVDITMKFKPVSGRGDQGAGIVWSYEDKDNYYIVRANALA